MNKSLSYYLDFLDMKAVHIQCLDEVQKPIPKAFASGFIINENKKNYLYTCWHVVTGFDMHNIEIKGQLPNRKYLKVSLQKSEVIGSGHTTVGGIQNTIIPLYTKNGKPNWIQNQDDKPNHSLNNIGLKVPSWNDIVKIAIDEDLALHETQIILEEDILKGRPSLGDKVYLVGYPYGFSALGLEMPTPIVLTRFIASRQIKDRLTEVLIDGAGAPGMSGCPVFIERNSRLYLTAIYNGLIYPDYVIEKNEKTTALGTISLLGMWWQLKKE